MFSSKDKDCKSLGTVQGYSDVRIKAKQWMDDDANHTYSQWKAMAPTKSAASKAGTGESRSEARKQHLMEKYGRKWRERTKRKESPEEREFREEEWLRQVLFTSSNRAAREMACTMIESLCQVLMGGSCLVYLETAALHCFVQDARSATKWGVFTGYHILDHV